MNTDSSLAGLRILVASPDAGFLHTVGDMLRHAGCEVLEAKDARSAAERAETDGPRMVILDEVVADADGGALLHELKRTRRERPVLVYETPKVLPLWICRADGEVRMGKPVRPEELTKALKRILAVLES